MNIDVAICFLHAAKIRPKNVITVDIKRPDSAQKENYEFTPIPEDLYGVLFSSIRKDQERSRGQGLWRHASACLCQYMAERKSYIHCGGRS